MAMDSHAPRSLVRRLLYALIVAVTSAFLRSKLRRHIERFRGLANGQGAIIIVADHESYFDTFAVVGLLQDIAGRRTYIPTKAKALVGFVRRAWHEALGAISIDPETLRRPTNASASTSARARPCSCSPKDSDPKVRPAPVPLRGLQPRDRLRRPRPYVAIGTGEVLPKGRLRLRGRRAEVVFGEPYVRPTTCAAQPTPRRPRERCAATHASGSSRG